MGDQGTRAVPTGIEGIADSLLDAVARCGAPVCVGLDPVEDRLPGSGKPVDRMRAFSLGVLDAVAEIVPCVKIQSACYERHGVAGCGVMEETIGAARDRGLVVILDGKRGDIGLSATHYAAAAFMGDHPADWLTINPYPGEDGVLPFLADGHGAFAIVRTSNPGGDEVQAVLLADGGTVSHAVARMVARIGDAFLGASGFSALGAVVGATCRSDAEELREIMPRQVFLVPGWGAQGGDADGILPCFLPGGTGAVVTASRSVIYHDGTGSWQENIQEAARQFADDVGTLTGHR